MLIKRKLQLVMVMPLFFVIVILLVSNYVFGVIESRDEKNNWFNDISYIAGQLNMIGYDVIMYPELERPKQQWDILISKLTILLSEHPFVSGEQRELINHLRKKRKKISQLYFKMINSRPNVVHNDVRRDQLAKQVLIQVLAIKSDMHRALKKNEIYYSNIRYQLVLLVVVVSFTFLLIIAVFIYYFYFSTIVPLEVLKRWSIGFVGGNLDDAIDLDKKNEFKQLADRFYEIGWQLKQNHLELDKTAYLLTESEDRAEGLLSYLDKCSRKSNKTLCLEWRTERGKVCLSSGAANFLGVKNQNNEIDFNDFINMIELEKRQSVIYFLERCRDAGKEFEMSCGLKTMHGKEINIILRGDILVNKQKKSVLIMVTVEDENTEIHDDY